MSRLLLLVALLAGPLTGCCHSCNRKASAPAAEPVAAAEQPASANGESYARVDAMWMKSSR